MATLADIIKIVFIILQISIWGFVLISRPVIRPVLYFIIGTLSLLFLLKGNAVGSQRKLLARLNYAFGSGGAWFIVIATPIAVMSAISYFYWMDQMREMVRMPLDAPKMIAEDATLPHVDPERFWGSYRSGVYFGLKTRSPRSPVVGLMWMTQFAGEMPPSVRHWCEQGDGLNMYSWFAHDGRSFGLQEIMDKYYTLTTDFVKRPGGDHGGDWTARISVKPRPGEENVVVSLFWYMALDGHGNLSAEVLKNRMSSISGYTEELGHFRMSFPKSTNTKKSNHLITVAPSLQHLKDKMLEGFKISDWGRESMKYLALGGRMVPRDQAETEPNFMVHQVTVALPFEMEIIFESGSAVNRPNSLSEDIYQAELNKHLANFDKKFEATFGLTKKGFDKDQIGYAKAAMSNMVGGVGYFYGQSLVSSDYTTKGPLQYWDAPLYTGVPSRSFFPRGFLWDEGFHNLLISKFDTEISRDIIGHWLDLMNTEGWIPREQILGDEARAKVPAEFVVQNNNNANPPTLFLPLQLLVKQLKYSEAPADRTYLKSLYPRLQAWYNWFNSSQLGDVPGTYRWKGRDANTKRELNPKTLSSGLDDYPRASHPTSSERHLDLRCWMALASGVMADIAKSLGEDSQAYRDTYKYLTDNKLLNALHWSDKGLQYSDYGLHTDNVKLQRPKPKDPKPGQRPQPPAEKERVTLSKPQEQFVNSFGYESLFPFLLKIVEANSPKLGIILNQLRDPNLLWTKFGLRSLAKSAPLYNKHNTEHDPPYWRGAIWININYLAVGALHHYANEHGPHATTAKEIYTELRLNLINNILKQYKSSGYIWEQYSDVTGEGKGSHPFTGWSALFVAIMAEQY